MKAKMAGVDNAGDIAVINRKLKFDKWSMSAEDAQFLQSRAFQIEEIARWFGLMPIHLGQTEKQTSWGTGVAEQNRGLARYNLEGWTTRLQERLTRLLTGSKKCEFDYTAFLQPDPEKEIELLISQVDAGLLTLNEARKIRNQPPVPGGDVLLINGVPLDELAGEPTEDDPKDDGTVPTTDDDPAVRSEPMPPLILPAIGANHG
ncbi:hypothetical protein B1R94_07805 [Mycolicibacterium litorale]|nr:hypothetical protein B1R94_07805 [Mycolicibacterium litorale]